MRVTPQPLCSTLAIATALLFPVAAGAQSFAGTGQVVHGSAVIDPTVTGPPFGNAVGLPNSSSPNTPFPTTKVIVNSSQVVINWTPTDNATNTSSPIQFQPVDTLALFTTAQNSSLTDFAVLNRIIPASNGRAIQLNGQVISSLQESTSQVAGKVWFYSPGGFIIGSTAFINVGSLGLTTSDPWSGSGNWLSPNNSVTLQPSLAGKSIDIANGAQIRASGTGNSYVAMVAPSITHRGSIAADGATALVAAEAATLTFKTDNLFDIQVNLGTTSATGVDVDGGQIGGPASGGSSDHQRIYLVAVPKNTALTMVVQGGADLGFTPAANASVDGSAIVLSAGSNVANGQVSTPASATAANLTLQDSTFRNAVDASATGTAQLRTANANLAFQNSVNVQGGAVALAVSGGRTISATGDMSLSADRTGAPGQNVTAGAVTLSVGTAGNPASAGTLDVDGTLYLSANATGDESGQTASGGSATGGSVAVQVHGNSQLTVGGDLLAEAGGWGGVGSASGGAGTGGTVTVATTATGASIGAGGEISLAAFGIGGGGNGASGAGGTGQGGNVTLDAQAGTVTSTGLELFADGWGGSADGGAAGQGLGGTALVQANVGDILVNSVAEGASLYMSARGEGGDSDGQAGALGDGGRVAVRTVSSGHGSITVQGSAELDASGIGGSSFGGGAGGRGVGGLSDNGGSIGSIAFNGGARIEARGVGGYSGQGTGGIGDGGDVRLVTTGATLSVSQLWMDAGANGGSGNLGGAGTGGSVTITSSGNGGLTLAGSADLFANGEGGSGFSGAGGNGRGGVLTLQALGGGMLTGLGTIGLNALGSGGSGFGANGGEGRGGTVFVGTNGADMTLDGYVGIDARGFGGGTSSGNGGTGRGGEIRVYADTSGDALFLNGGLQADAGGSGGGLGGFDVASETVGALSAGTGGLGDGGVATVSARNGAAISISGSAMVTAVGRGGDMYGQGVGGNGLGGFALLEAVNGGTLTVGGYAGLNASGFGGTGTTGGSGIGGGVLDPVTGLWIADGAQVFADGGTVRLNGPAEVLAQGQGGEAWNGGAGGLGKGGVAFLVAENSDHGSSLIEALGFTDGVTLWVSADGTGGRGGDGSDGNDGLGGVAGASGGAGSSGLAGGDGGTGQGGFAAILGSAGNGTIRLSSAAVTADGAGGAGGRGGSGGTGGNGGAGAPGTGSNGGQGGAGGTGADGGAGGSGIGGSALFGSLTGRTKATASNLGLVEANYVRISASGSGGSGGDAGWGGEGGLGGAGGSGSPAGANGAPGGDGAGGTGGIGGNAQNGAAVLVASGSLVDVFSAELRANATGGAGGFGGIDGSARDGAGGNATIGGDNAGVAVFVTTRNGFPARPGKLVSSFIDAEAVATGGFSANGFGASVTRGGNLFQFLNGTGELGSVQFAISASAVDPAAAVDLISVDNSNVQLSGEFAFETSGTLALTSANGGTLTAGTITLAAADFVRNPGQPNPINPGTYTANVWNVTTGDDFIVTAQLKSNGSLTVAAPGEIDVYNIDTAGALNLDAQGGDINGRQLTSGGLMTLLANSDITTGNINGAGGINARAINGTADFANVTSAANVSLRAGQNVLAPNVNAGGSLTITTDVGDINAGLLTSGGLMTLLANSDITTGNINGAGGINARAINGTADFATVTSAANVSLRAGQNVQVPNVNAGGTLNITTDVGDIDVGQLTSGGLMTLLASSDITTGNINGTGGIDARAINGSIDVGNVTSAGDVLIQAKQQVQALDLNAEGSLTVIADASFIDGELVIAGTGVTFLAATDINLSDIDSNSGDVRLESTGGGVGTGDIDSVGGVYVEAAGNVGLGNVLAAGAVELVSTGGGIITDNITADHRIVAQAAGAIIMENLTTSGSGSDVGYDVRIASNTSVRVDDVAAQGGVHLISGGTIDADLLTAGADVLLLGQGNISTQAITAGAQGSLLIGNDSMAALGGSLFAFNAGSVLAAADIAASGGSANLGAVNVGLDMLASVGTNLTTGAVTAGRDIDFLASQAVTTGALNAGGVAVGAGNGNVTLGNVVAGDFAAFGSGAALQVSNVTAPNGIALGGTTSLTAGNLLASQGNVLLLANGAVQTGAITTAPDGQLLIAGLAMLPLGGEIGEDYDPAPVLGATTITPTNGSVTIGGPVSASLVRAYAGQNLTVGAITADQVLLSTGQLASLTGQISAPITQVISGDIDIGANGRIVGDYAVLTSRNAAATLVGDGLTGPGYALSDAELDRVQTTFGWTVEVAAGLGAAPKMTIGNLTFAAPQGGSERSYRFAVRTSSGQPTGTIRVDGNVAFTGMGSSDGVEFGTDIFQLNTATGSVGLSGSGGALAGYLDIFADRVHVADSAILNKLAADPNYAGREKELHKPAAVQRPEGVLRAAEIKVWNPLQVLVQNTGSYAVPAGVLATSGEIVAFGGLGDGLAAQAASQVEMIINGQIAGEGGTITGPAVWQAIVIDDEEFDPTPFTPNSSINNCLLTATVCRVTVPPREPPPTTPRNEDVVVGKPDPLDDKEFGDGEGGGPIVPPEALVDGRPLNLDLEVEEPVTGAGNPGLMGGPSDEDEEEEEEEEGKAEDGTPVAQDAANKEVTP